jgi:hypothetical protein
MSLDLSRPGSKLTVVGRCHRCHCQTREKMQILLRKEAEACRRMMGHMHGLGQGRICV